MAGCDKPVKVKKRALCATHYDRWHRHGDPTVWKRPVRTACSVDGCELRVDVREARLCDRHLRRLKRYGTTDAPERPAAKTCATTGCDVPAYAHGRCDRHYRRQRHGVDGDRRCKFCGSVLDQNLHASRAYCSGECKERLYFLTRRASYRANWLKQYGLTEAKFDELLAEQNGGCAVCGSETSNGRGEHLHVDHDHETGVVRGILCHDCNTGLGKFKDNPALLRAAADYLERAGAGLILTLRKG